MSYARFSDDSDVYVFENTDGKFECCWCPLQEREWVEDPDAYFGGVFRNVGETVPHLFDTPTQMLRHLELHTAKGHLVPDEAVAQLRAEADEMNAERRFVNTFTTQDPITAMAKEGK